MNDINELKAQCFDILRSQQTLQLEVQSLEQQKNEVLKKIAEIESKDRSQPAPAVL